MDNDPDYGDDNHPVSTSVGAASGAVTGGLVGAAFGPIGMLVGAAAGAVGGGVAGHEIGEAIDGEREDQYWRDNYRQASYTDEDADYDQDYGPAYQYGYMSRAAASRFGWDDDVESQLRSDWESNRGTSQLDWDDARAPVQDAYERADRTYATYNEVRRAYKDEYRNKPYFSSDYDYEQDYEPAYRYGAYARGHHYHRDWDDQLEAELEEGWNDFKYNSRLAWNEAKDATRDAFNSIERAIPGDADGDGR